MTEKVFSASVELLIPFHDVDMMGVVWHGHYAKYFEIARCQLLQTFDYDYVQMKESNYAWPIVEQHLKFVKPARFNDRICVTAKLTEYEHRLRIVYEIVNISSGERLAKGFTIQVAIDMQSGEMCFLSPPVLFHKLGISNENG